MKVVLTVTAGPAQGQVFTFEEPDTFLFGRAQDARVSLPNDPFVSRHHFLLEINPPNCRVSDLDSKNGTFVNNVRYGGKKEPKPGVPVAPGGATGTMVGDGHEIVVGDTRIAVQIDITSDGTRTYPGSGQAADPGEAPTLLDDDPELYASPQGIENGDTEPVPAPGQPNQPSQPSQLATMIEAPPAPHPLPTVPTGAVTQVDPPVASAPPPARGPAPPLPINPVKPAAPPSPPSSPFGAPSQANTQVSQPPTPRAREVVRSGHTPRDGRSWFDGYRIENELGRGGMGVVYKGTDLDTGQPVAIKTLLPQVAVSFQHFRTFYREIELTRQMQHPHIVRVIAHGKVKGAYYCVMEFVDGMDLKQLLKERGGKLEPEEALPIMLGMLDGLAFAHRAAIQSRGGGRTQVFHGIVHRDLKPENILLARAPGGWSPKVADFGISKSFESAGMTDLTMGGGVCGTPVYWPREQITHYRYLCPPTDVFSIAMVLHEMLTGVWARPGIREVYEQARAKKRAPDLSDFMRVIAANPIPKIGEVVRGLPPPIADVVDRALLEKEVPNDEQLMRQTLARLRYPDAGGFREALGHAMQYCGYDVPPPV